MALTKERTYIECNSVGLIDFNNTESVLTAGVVTVLHFSNNRDAFASYVCQWVTNESQLPIFRDGVQYGHYVTVNRSKFTVKIGLNVGRQKRTSLRIASVVGMLKETGDNRCCFIRGSNEGRIWIG
jgi:hypothetical protein